MYLKKLWLKTSQTERMKHIQVQEAQKVPNRPTPGYIIAKMAKVKEDSKGSKRKTESVTREPT